MMPRTRVFAWRLSREALPTKNRLATKGVNIEGGCYLCEYHEEMVSHLFFDCPYLIAVLNVTLPSSVLPFMTDAN